MLKDDDVKAKKPNSHETGLEQSLTQVKKKWPKCVPTAAGSIRSDSGNSAESSSDFQSSNGNQNSIKERHLETDPVSKVLPSPEELVKNLCRDDSNPIVDMLDQLNAIKRVEALEVSFKTMTSLMESLLKTQSNSKEKLDKLQQQFEESSDERSTSVAYAPTGSMFTHTSNAPVESFEESSHEADEDLHESDGNNEKPEACIGKQEIEDIVQQHVEGATQHLLKTVSCLKRNNSLIQKETDDMKEQLDDLMFASEQNELKIDDTASDIKNFTSKIFCLKTDVKTLMKGSLEFKEKFSAIATELEALNNVKTNKSYVDELWRQKAFNSDLELYVRREEFEPVSDIIRLKLALLEEHFTKLPMSLKKSLACFKSELDEKLDKEELGKFKNAMSTSFEAFLRELQVLLCDVMKTSTGIGGTKSPTSHDFNCISCKSKIAMNKSSRNIPQLDSMAFRFRRGLDGSCPKAKKSSFNSDFRRFFGAEEKPAKDKVVRDDPRLNFPNSQPCFIVSKDNSIWKADPLKCLNSSKYLQS